MPLRQRALYGMTVFTGALLLFLVQPVMARAILPWFGGSAGVWTTSMLFFQSLLLLGYWYAHWIIRRLGPGVRMGLHLALLAASLAVLPVAPAAAWKPTGPEEPMPRILALLAASVGLPYFLLSTTTPLVQSWYAAAGAVPYRLFAVSNLASLAALVAYPVAIEPWLPLGIQFRAWSAAYAAFAVLCGIAAISAPRVKKASFEERGAPWRERLLWMALAACPAALWMAVANQLSQNVAPVPFLWVLPLSLYLLSFVLTFDRDGWYRPRVFRLLLPLAWLAMCFGLADQAGTSLKWSVLLLCGGMFVCAMFCHGDLARRKPDPRELTSYYLMIAVGGVLGGAFVALVSPLVFTAYLELPVALVSCVVLALPMVYEYTATPRRLARLAIVAAAGFLIGISLRNSMAHNVIRRRNFYGVLEVAEGKGPNGMRVLYNGSIIHGTEFLNPARSRIPTAYYGRYSGGGLAVGYRQGKGQHVGLVGLGAGTLAVYGRAGDSLRFYEINPQVMRLARETFHYLRECPARVEVVEGDARLSLEREPAQNFDALLVDAFSSDSVPVHLLTREAFALYFRHLKPDGILALHLTNKCLDLEPVVKTAAEAFNKPALMVKTGANGAESSAAWALIGGDAQFMRRAEAAGSPLGPRRVRLWTDDFSNVFQLLK